jgi:hypothetical protein
MTAMTVRHENTLNVDRLYESYAGLRLTRRNESGSRTIPVAHFGEFEVRLIEFVDCNHHGSSDLWIELYSHDTLSSIDSCLCRDPDEVENLGAHFISQARELYETNGWDDLSR